MLNFLNYWEKYTKRKINHVWQNKQTWWFSIFFYLPGTKYTTDFTTKHENNCQIVCIGGVSLLSETILALKMCVLLSNRFLITFFHLITTKYIWKITILENASVKMTEVILLLSGEPEKLDFNLLCLCDLTHLFNSHQDKDTQSDPGCSHKDQHFQWGYTQICFNTF